MKKLLLLLFLFPLITSAFVVPEKPTGFVQDYAGLLSVEEKNSLETKIQNFEQNTTNEIAVVTILSLDGDTIENVAQEIFTKWGIGKKDKNNGVLLLISLNDRRTRIHTGYGVEGDLTDIGTSYIQSDVITPAFREERYFDGINNAVDKMIEALGGTNIVPENYSVPSNTSNYNWEIIFIAIIFGFQFLIAVLAQSKSWWGGGVVGGVLGIVIWNFLISSILLAIPVVVILILFGLFVDYVVSNSYSKARASGVYPWWMSGGGGRGGGFGGGGFGGFGGGASGGGGSSGRW